MTPKSMLIAHISTFIKIEFQLVMYILLKPMDTWNLLIKSKKKQVVLKSILARKS